MDQHFVSAGPLWFWSNPSESRCLSSECCFLLHRSRAKISEPALSRIVQNRATLGALLSRVTTNFYSGATLSSVKSDLIRLWSSSASFPEFTLFQFWSALEVRYGNIHSLFLIHRRELWVVSLESRYILVYEIEKLFSNFVFYTELSRFEVSWTFESFYSLFL